MIVAFESHLGGHKPNFFQNTFY